MHGTKLALVTQCKHSFEARSGVHLSQIQLESKLQRLANRKLAWAITKDPQATLCSDNALTTILHLFSMPLKNGGSKVKPQALHLSKMQKKAAYYNSLLRGSALIAIHWS
jgi:hypothetical protein